MPGPDLSLPPKPPVPNFDSPISPTLPQKPSRAFQPQQLTPPRSAISLGSQDPTRCLTPVPFPTPATYQLSPSPSLSNQTPLRFTPFQGLPSPSVLPLGGVTTLHSITPSPRLQSPANGAIARRRHQRKHDPGMLPSAHSPSYRSQRPRLRPRPTGKTPPWRTDRRRADVNSIPFQPPEQFHAPPENMTRPHTPIDKPVPSEQPQNHAEGTSPRGTEDTGAVDATQQQKTHLDGADPIRRLFHFRLDSGVKCFNDKEQRLLCGYIDISKEEQRDLVYRLAEQVPWYNRNPLLTYKLANWVHSRDRNYKVASKLLIERLNILDLGDGKMMMSLEEVNELMDCQITIDAYSKWLKEQEGKQGKENENEKEKEAGEGNKPSA
ncbi:hypothetical protein F4814DRAFT_448603 [Daldinia grandis]|nr:hypothetical protein F4814DRAFT_448603 [Daldinia grandis]